MKNKVNFDRFTTMETIEAVADGLNNLKLEHKVEAIKAACTEDELTELGYQLTLLAVNMARTGEEDEDPIRKPRVMLVDPAEIQEADDMTAGGAFRRRQAKAKRRSAADDAADREEFVAFCQGATDRQLQGIYSKERHYGRPIEAALVLLIAEQRGVTIDPEAPWTGEGLPK